MPVVEQHWRNRSYCGKIDASHIGKKVILSGWVDAIRDHGNLIFIHLRDISGIVQIVFDPAVGSEAHLLADALNTEDIIGVSGNVVERDSTMRNPLISTGDLEVYADSLIRYAEAKSLPFPISEKAMVLGEELSAAPWKVDEELRIKFRYLDLRRPSMKDFFIKRHRISKTIRDFLSDRGFIEIETPVLTKSTPEGSRDYLVPSRMHKGRFYALPQSPQLFKQLLMMAGFDRYYQIVRCFRDEDLRPNRQPEFTQLDMEASFIDEEFIYETLEALMQRIASVAGIELRFPFPRMTYNEAMERYGTDRPDTRFDMTFEDLTAVFSETSYDVFRKVAAGGGVIKGICARGKAGILSKNILQNEYALKIVPSFGAKGMTWMKVKDGALHSNIVQFFSDDEQKAIIETFKASDGDVIMMIADESRQKVTKALSSLRLHLAERLSMIPQDSFSPLWVTRFPLFEEKDGDIQSQHHPFTMPDRLDFDPLDRRSLLSLSSRAYDLVLNGDELGGGSIRIHRADLQKKIFEALGLGESEIEEKFGFFLRALEHGAPPHGGIALGLDRLTAMLLRAPSIREVIAFPKNRSAACPLTDAPSWVSDEQLRELGLLPHGKEQELSTPKGSDERGLNKAHDSATAEKISLEEVHKVASLARIRLTEGEARNIRGDLNSILGYVEALSQVDVDEVSPMSHVLPLDNVWRDDRTSPCSMSKSLIEGSPEADSGYFKVPRILEG